MPVHNDAAYLDECIQSTIQQEYSNWEYCIVNDGSTDSSSWKLKNGAKLINEFIHFMPHQGIVPALNTAAKLASGSIIARMDADDIMHPKRLSEQVSFLNENSEVGLIGFVFGIFQMPRVDPYQMVLHHEEWSNRILNSEDIHNALLQNRRLLTPLFVCERKSLTNWGDTMTAHGLRIMIFFIEPESKVSYLARLHLYLLTKDIILNAFPTMNHDIAKL